MTLRTTLLRLARMGSPIQRRLGLTRPSGMEPARRPLRQRGVLLGTALALLISSPSLQVAGGTADLAAPMPAPVPPLVVPAEAEPGHADGALAGGTQPVSLQPAAFQPVGVQQHRIQVEGVMPNGLIDARTVEGVAFATAVRIGEVSIGPVSPPTPVRVAAVDPGEFRVLTAQPVADVVTLWENVSGGDVALTHELAGRLGAHLGHPLTMRAEPVRVGAIASNTTPPVADAIVATATGERLGLAQVPQTLLVAVHEGVSPEEVARRLEQRLGARAMVIPDPRAPRPVPVTGKITPGNVWDRLAMCESGGNWHINTGNGYYGGLQFLPESWYWVGGKGLPHEASREEQIYRATLLLALQGWKAWPACSLKLGLRRADPGERAYGAAATGRGPTPAPKPASSGGGGTNTQPSSPPPTSQPAPQPKPSESERNEKLRLLPPLND